MAKKKSISVELMGFPPPVSLETAQIQDFDRETADYLLARVHPDGGFIDVITCATADDIRKFFAKPDGGKGEAQPINIQAEIHKRIAPLLTKRQQGRVMGEIREVIAAPQAIGKGEAVDEHTVKQIGARFGVIYEDRIVFHDDKFTEFAEALEAHYTAPQAECASCEAQPIATLHDDGHWVWKGTPPHESNYVGWRMEVYAAPTPERADAEKDAALTNEQIEAAIKAWFDTDGKDVDDHQSRMRAAILAASKEK
jgi:hypothetical protein